MGVFPSVTNNARVEVCPEATRASIFLVETSTYEDRSEQSKGDEGSCQNVCRLMQHGFEYDPRHPGEVEGEDQDLQLVENLLQVHQPDELAHAKRSDGEWLGLNEKGP